MSKSVLGAAAITATAVLTLGASSVSAAKAPPPVPHIAHVTVHVTGPSLSLTITGRNFGRRYTPYRGDSKDLWLRDLTRGWQAGNSNQGNLANVTLVHWTARRVVVLYDERTNGKNLWRFQAGDHIEVRLANPQDGRAVLWRGRVPSAR